MLSVNSPGLGRGGDRLGEVGNPHPNLPTSTSCP